MVTVAQLIAFLQTQPQDLQVIYEKHSEQKELYFEDISFFQGCEPRNDGWIHDPRPDKPTRTYLRFPGN